MSGTIERASYEYGFIQITLCDGEREITIDLLDPTRAEQSDRDMAEMIDRLIVAMAEGKEFNLRLPLCGPEVDPILSERNT